METQTAIQIQTELLLLIALDLGLDPKRLQGMIDAVCPAYYHPEENHILNRSLQNATDLHQLEKGMS